MTNPAFFERVTCILDTLRGAVLWSLALHLTLHLAPVQAQTGATAQDAPVVKPPARCLLAAQLKANDLYGQWTVQFSAPPRGLPAQASLQLHKHAEFSDSLAGWVLRDLSAAPGGKVPGHSIRAQLAGDIEAGALMLDESSNGTNLTASWDGQVVEGSCGKLVKGTWKDLSSDALPDAPEVPFTLTRHGGW
jgi:hypothetical protein